MAPLLLRVSLRIYTLGIKKIGVPIHNPPWKKDHFQTPGFQRVRYFLEITQKVKRLKCPLFLVREGPRNSRGVREHAPPENLLNSLEMYRRVRYLSFKPFLLGASMLLWSAWANTRDKKIDRTRTDWTLAEVQCQWRNEFGIHEHFWKLKTLSYLPEQCQCVRNTRVGLRAWDCIEMSETHAQCVRIESSAFCSKI